MNNTYKLLDRFGLNKIQTTKSILIELQKHNITDITEAIDSLEVYITEQARLYDINAYKTKAIINKTPQIVRKSCPSCGYPNMRMGKELDGMKYNGCPKCRYSEVA